MCCAYWIFFRLADERMNGTGGGGWCARDAERGKELVPGNRKVSGRVFGAAPGPPPETSQGGVAAHRAWRQRNASVVVRRNINHIGMVVYGVYAICL